MSRPRWTTPYFAHDPPVTGDNFHIADCNVQISRDQFSEQTEMTFKFKVYITGTPNVLKLVKGMGRMVASYLCQGFGISTPDADELDKLYFDAREEKEIDYAYKARRKIDLGEDK